MSVLERINKLKKGENLVYYTGFLLRDRKRAVVITGIATLWADNPEVMKVRDEAWTAYQMGLVRLTQRRVGDGTWDYIATRR